MVYAGSEDAAAMRLPVLFIATEFQPYCGLRVAENVVPESVLVQI
jgi:hypothetical protein